MVVYFYCREKVRRAARGQCCFHRRKTCKVPATRQQGICFRCWCTCLSWAKALGDRRERKKVALQGTGRDLLGNETETLQPRALGQVAPLLCTGCTQSLIPTRSRQGLPWLPAPALRPRYSSGCRSPSPGRTGS